ncbi:MAG: hypothetical protein KAR20_11385 [Candidatus Heimdallarchaeota archaeon]|nr:hypothetical protein [Candidatus Heimdallarchaeota archaeon]
MSEEIDFINGYRKEWMSDDQWECYKLAADLFRGFHHLPRKIKPFGTGIEMNPRGSFSTYDFSHLTEMVLLCHERCIRGEILPSGPGRLKLVFHKRHAREGRMSERHPTIEEVLKNR